MAVRCSGAPSTVACAPMGTWLRPERGPARPLSVTAACVRVVQRGAGVETGAGGAGFQRQRSLRRGAHHSSARISRDAASPARRSDRRREQDGVVLARIELAQARVEIARTDSTVRSGRSWRSCAAGARNWFPTRAAGGQIGERAAHTASRGSSRWGTAASTRPRQLGGQILQAVHGEIGAAVEQGFLNLLGEETFGPDFGERHVGDLVAGGLDDFDAARKPGA